MSTNTRPLPIAAALGRGLRGALQWRLLLLWALATLVCALIGALPAWGWLGTLFGHSVHATAVAGGEAPALVLEALTQRDAPMSLLGASSMGAGLLMLVLSPLLVGATVSAIRARTRLGFGDLLRGGIGEYGPMLRMLLWSAVPLGIALAAGSGILAANAAAHKQAVVAAELDALGDPDEVDGPVLAQGGGGLAQVVGVHPQSAQDQVQVAGGGPLLRPAYRGGRPGPGRGGQGPDVGGGGSGVEGDLGQAEVGVALLLIGVG